MKKIFNKFKNNNFDVKLKKGIALSFINGIFIIIWSIISICLTLFTTNLLVLLKQQIFNEDSVLGIIIIVSNLIYFFLALILILLLIKILNNKSKSNKTVARICSCIGALSILGVVKPLLNGNYFAIITLIIGIISLLAGIWLWKGSFIGEISDEKLTTDNQKDI